jgi:hypothetical protein
MKRKKRQLMGATVGLWLAGLATAAAQAPGTLSPDPYAPITEVPSDSRLIEGDILVPRDWIEPRTAYDVNLWPNGVVPFEFGPNVTQANQDLMRAAMDEWESLVNVQFVPRGNENDYVFIRNATFNASDFVGHVGGQQRVFILNWTVHGTLVHELGHVLAFWHEQSRADRNNFITVNFGNVCQNCCTDAAGNPISCNGQFTIRTSGAEHGPYDFGSVMHYPACAFSNCATCAPTNAACATITVLPPDNAAWQANIGQRVGASYWDGRIMHFLYPESNWIFADSAFGGVPLGTFVNPWSTFAAGYVTTPDNGKLWLKSDPYSGPREYAFTGRIERPMRIETTAGSAVIGR